MRQLFSYKIDIVSRLCSPFINIKSFRLGFPGIHDMYNVRLLCARVSCLQERPFLLHFRHPKFGEEYLSSMETIQSE